MKLELGGGRFPQEGFVSLDLEKFTDSTIVHNLEEGLPLISEKVTEILADNVLEHINNLIPLMNQCHDVLEPGGLFKIIVPLFPTIGAIKDPTHVRFFIEESFDYFDQDWDYERQPDYGIKKWKVLLKTIEGDDDYKYITVFMKKEK